MEKLDNLKLLQWRHGLVKQPKQQKSKKCYEHVHNVVMCCISYSTFLNFAVLFVWCRLCAITDCFKRLNFSFIISISILYHWALVWQHTSKL